MHNFYLIGHRGVAGERFENSMSGFEHALTLDLDAVELDIRQHAGIDGIFTDYPSKLLSLL